MKKQDVISKIPQKFLEYWKKYGIDKPFDKHRITFISSCGFVMIQHLSYASIKKMNVTKLDKWTVLSFFTFTKTKSKVSLSFGWNNIHLKLARSRYIILGDNLPLKELNV